MSNINDVARLAQVSKATVSRVLSGSRGVKEESRQAVLRAAEILNYKPNAIAQSLSSQSTNCIGVICATEHIQQSTGYLQALEKQLNQHHKHLLLRFANDHDSVALAAQELSNGLCDALLVVGARFSLPPLDDDIMLIDCLSGSNALSIQCDHVFAAETAVHYLCNQKRRQIALINFASGEAAAQTLEGYHQALHNHVVPFNRQLVIEDESSVRIALQRLINRGVKFSALLVTDDTQAQEAVMMLNQYQLQVPEQVMVFSLDGSTRMPGANAIPAIKYPLESIARRAVELLLGDRHTSDLVRGSLLIA
ncbi:DNA-binding LacI/PurR family transcriptional regulator [Buttiauxella sp. BIGb0471]|uniref:LacI family DNA-binding transcriptional regulator n=1 Tax=Buttiauxella sp. BIGb0471 TaxID=2940597 RepID=UPI0021690DDD|nr:LacI family DNA-binding transcriptional regulator [Buttiauxella sp. BIGb0471]MCS3601673.1 DNA-binding LacI/PurR family transcriptional regulator [Buttiauxella sp. BIGb0471]